MLARRSWLIILMIALMAVWGCSDDDSPVAPGGTSQTAFEAFVAAAAPVMNDNAQTPGVIDASTVNTNLNDYTVIDIRSQADFDISHIPGAYHSSFTTLLTDLEMTIPKGKPYVVACYSGQSAGHVKLAMELMGYGDVYSLKFGMSAWKNDLDKWTSKCGDNLPLAQLETANNNANLVDHAFPTLSGDANTIVATRVATMLQNGFKAKSWASISANLDEYFIMNYFGEPDYLGTGTSGVPGHIEGAFQFTPYMSLADDEMLKKLPTDKPIIVYCWTGQHSSQVTAYLNMLGYEAYSLANGSNHLFYNSLTAHKWAQSYDFPLWYPTP